MVTENSSANSHDTTMIEVYVDKIFSKLNIVNKISCSSSIAEKHRNDVATTIKQNQFVAAAYPNNLNDINKPFAAAAYPHHSNDINHLICSSNIPASFK